jgi:hypothetical protein
LGLTTCCSVTCCSVSNNIVRCSIHANRMPFLFLSLSTTLMTFWCHSLHHILSFILTMQVCQTRAVGHKARPCKQDTRALPTRNYAVNLFLGARQSSVRVQEERHEVSEDCCPMRLCTVGQLNWSVRSSRHGFLLETNQ